jgi:hypothetical protein
VKEKGGAARDSLGRTTRRWGQLQRRLKEEIHRM